MFNLNDENGNALVVALGLVIAHLFIYGRKIKKNIKIKASELVGDFMQLGAMFVGAMSFFGGLELLHMRPQDTWQVVMITILFAMSFETYFQRARDAFQERMGMVTAAILGKLPDDAMMKVPAGKGVPDVIEVDIPIDPLPPPPTATSFLPKTYKLPKGDTPPEHQEELDKLD
jgi:hypothetical protein